MADIEVTITIPDALVSRVSAATGATTTAQYQNWVRDSVKKAVVAHEAAEASEAEEAKVATAEAAKLTAVDAAVAKAESEIILS